MNWLTQVSISVSSTVGSRYNEPSIQPNSRNKAIWFLNQSKPSRQKSILNNVNSFENNVIIEIIPKMCGKPIFDCITLMLLYQDK